MFHFIGEKAGSASASSLVATMIRIFASWPVLAQLMSVPESLLVAKVPLLRRVQEAPLLFEQSSHQRHEMAEDFGFQLGRNYAAVSIKYKRLRQAGASIPQKAAKRGTVSLLKSNCNLTGIYSGSILLRTSHAQPKGQPRLYKLAINKRCRLYLPSGELCRAAGV
jgi:hypothetical protein